MYKQIDCIGELTTKNDLQILCIAILLYMKHPDVAVDVKKDKKG